MGDTFRETRETASAASEAFPAAQEQDVKAKRSAESHQNAASAWEMSEMPPSKALKASESLVTAEVQAASLAANANEIMPKDNRAARADRAFTDSENDKVSSKSSASMAAAETPIGSPRATPSIGIATPVDVGRNTAATATATCTTASQDGPSESSALLESEELRDRRLFLWQVNSPDQGNTKKQHHCRAESLFEDSDDDCSDSALVKSPLKPRDLNAAFDAVPPPMEMDLELGREVGSEGRTGLKFQPEKLSDCVHDVPVASWQRHMLEFFGPRMQPVTFHRPLRLGTSCSGTGAPRIGLRTLGFPVLETASADPKPATMKFMRDVAQLSCHHFASVDNLQKRSGYCHVHEKMCTLEAIRDDLYVAGFPCSPFSRQRADRFTSAAGWRAHPQAAVMFGVAADIRTREPLLAVLENVTGFVMASKDEAAQGPSVHHPDVKRDSPLDALLSAVNDGTDVQHPRYFACWQHVDGDLWSGFPRPRVYIMLVHRDLGVSVLKDAACILRDALEHCKGKEPLTFAETLLPKDSTVLANQMAKHQVALQQSMLEQEERQGNSESEGSDDTAGKFAEFFASRARRRANAAGEDEVAAESVGSQDSDEHWGQEDADERIGASLLAEDPNLQPGTLDLPFGHSVETTAAATAMAMAARASGAEPSGSATVRDAAAESFAEALMSAMAFEDEFEAELRGGGAIGAMSESGDENRNVPTPPAPLSVHPPATPPVRDPSDELGRGHDRPASDSAVPSAPSRAPPVRGSSARTAALPAGPRLVHDGLAIRNDDGSILAWIKHKPQSNDFFVNCSLHENCTKTKTLRSSQRHGRRLQGRPLGFLAAWAVQGHACLSKEAHSLVVPSFLDRKNARARLRQEANASEFFVKERDRRSDEPDSEPDHCP
ncbi:CHT1 [Symbiodinium sp. CCMP2592]|nr:CHT1 [Symbiodinium sp. CCMP2592]